MIVYNRDPILDVDRLSCGSEGCVVSGVALAGQRSTRGTDKSLFTRLFSQESCCNVQYTVKFGSPLYSSPLCTNVRGNLSEQSAFTRKLVLRGAVEVVELFRVALGSKRPKKSAARVNERLDVRMIPHI